MSAAKRLNAEKNFRVVVRLCAPNRPEHSVSLDEPRASIKVTHLNRVVVDTGRSHKPHIIALDAVLDEEASQRDVYDSTTKSLVEYLMQGYNGCVIVYGSPGSGKTHTMQGCSVSAKHRGIISRAAEDIFACIKPSGSPKASHCKIRVSFYHIFNEKIYDLLDPKASEVIWVRDCEEVVRLDGLTEVEVHSAQDLLQVHRRGSALRHTVHLSVNSPPQTTPYALVSSRNHCLRSDCYCREIEHTRASHRVSLYPPHEGVLTASKLTLVDLASSGKCRRSVVPDIKRAFNATNENLQETKMLKRSLTIFGNVIFALSSAGSQHVPYRESKLTRALRDCLGGNCRTCLVVTVSSQSSSVSETLSSLQFASRAMAVPSRPIYTSQLHYTPEQSQTCLLPVLLSSVSPSEPKLSSSGDGLELRSFLPQLEKPGQTEPPGHYSRGSRPVDEKNRADGRTRSLSRSLPGAVLHDAGGKERTGKGSEFSSSHRRSLERLSTSSLEPFSSPSAVVECPNCSRERKIREEYDKIIVQARRDKDSLSQKVAELENELRMRATQPREEGSNREKKGGNEESISNTSADPGILKTAEVCLQSEAEGLRSELSACHEREKLLTQTLHSERERLTEDIQELLTQLNSTREKNSQLVSALNNQRESLLAQLQTSRDELERFQESASLTLSQLKTEKVCLENAGLRQKLKSFVREINSAPFTESSTHAVTTNTEMIVVSHHVSQQCPAAGSFSQCERFQHPEVEFTEKSETTNNSNCEQPLFKPHNIYKQLRREHSLLLDVMLVLYRREWFLQDAIPYVRRTLRKCGLRPEDID
ncbi:Kinesin heavy chain [Labeo rohita]|uniref:Kinesin heavy chain n=1 Tax=Labeo rohita TaxID=84645 RepID=A0ABQ8LUK8_LABRO|nr:Kinesin heavy chain [Labeo rohita]